MPPIAPQRYKLVSVLILISGAIWISFSATFPGGNSNSRIPAPQQGFLAPDFSLQTFDGETITLSEFRGQPVLVNLWASWCGPCRQEMPAMERVYREYKGKGFVILAVNATNQDSISNARSFVNELGLSFPILLDREGLVSKLYHLRALPTSFFIDKNGMIQEVVIGGPMAEALLRTRVERLLGEAE